MPFMFALIALCLLSLSSVSSSWRDQRLNITPMPQSNDFLPMWNVNMYAHSISHSNFLVCPANEAPPLCHLSDSVSLSIKPSVCFGPSVLPSTHQSVFVYMSKLTSFSDGINTGLNIGPLSSDHPDVSISPLRTSHLSGESYMEGCALWLGHFICMTLVFMQKFVAYLSYMHWLSRMHSL
jgi:hypothetical protein